MIELIFVLIALFGATIASITDLKEGIIPNKLSFSLLAIGILGHLTYNLYSLFQGTMSDLSLFVLTIENVAIIFVIGYIFWRLGGWSAGDTKIFMFLAALIPQYPIFLKRYFTPKFYPEAFIPIQIGSAAHRINILPYPFAITLLVNTFLAIFPFIFIFSAYISITKLGLKRFLEPLDEIRDYAVKSLIFIGAIAIIQALGLSKILIIPILIILFLIEEKKAIIVSAFLIILYSLFGGTDPASGFRFIALNYIVIFILLLVFDIFLNAFTVLRKEALQKEVKITSLEEGMVVAENIYRENDKIVRDSRGLTDKIKEAIEKKDMEIILKKHTLLVNTSAAGITESEIKTLQTLVEKEEMEDKVKIKNAMPFAPIILLGLIISLTIGDLASYISLLI